MFNYKYQANAFRQFATDQYYTNAEIDLIMKTSPLRVMQQIIPSNEKERLISKGVLPEKIKMIYNWSDDDKIHFNKRNENIAVSLGMAGRFNVVFAGNMGKAQALEAVLSAAGIIDGVKPEVQFIFIGGGIEMERLRVIAEEKHSENVAFEQFS